MALTPPRIPESVHQTARIQGALAASKEDAADIALRVAWGKLEGDVNDRVGHLKEMARAYLDAVANPSSPPENTQAKRRGLKRALSLLEDQDEARARERYR